MQRKRARIEKSFEKRVGRDHCARSFSVEGVTIRVVVTLGKYISHFQRPTQVRFLVNADELPFLQIAVDAVCLNPITNFVLRRFRKVPKQF